MFDILLSISAFLLMIGILVAFHEWGHFITARLCGVKVLRFSIGFGRPLFKWTDKYHCEFVLASIPLGGYVKMLDEREGEVAPAELSYAFNRKPVWQRFLIVLAGPIANLLLAIFFFWIVLMWGMAVTVPRIGAIEPNSPAMIAQMQPGEEIIQINGEEIRSWQATILALVDELASSDPISIVTLDESKTQHHYSVQVNEWPEDISPSAITSAIGIELYQPIVPALLGTVIAGSAADNAGLKVGDVITHLDHEPTNWSSLVQQIKNSPDQTMTLTVQRGKKNMTLQVVPDSVLEGTQSRGMLGVGVDAKVLDGAMVRMIRLNPLDAFIRAVDKTKDYTALTFEMIWKMITGHASLDNLSGPVSIAKGAGYTAHSGFIYYLSFMALVSVSLGVLNLLPVPLLDGGHLLFYIFEIIRGQPLSDRIQAFSMRLGGIGLLMLMSVAFYNDILRLF